MPRYRIIGTPKDSSEYGTTADQYIDAPDRNEARRMVESDWERIDEIRQVPNDEGRSFVWRLIKRLWG